MNLEQHRVALVTGAAGGIGSAVGRELAAQGAALCLVDLAPSATLAAELRTSGHNVIDILVNVAGPVKLGAAADISEAEWDRVPAVKSKGTFLACQAAMAPMKEQHFGRIINFGSVLGKNGGMGCD